MQRTKGGLLVHYCYCGQWGAFGFGVSLLKGQDGTWLCSEHKEEGEGIKLKDDYLSHIPTRYRGVCDFCQHDLDTREPGVHQWTSGWVMNRTGGGGHGISLPIRENKWAHRWCVERAVKGQQRQDSLSL